jgi:flagellar protein FlaG
MDIGSIVKTPSPLGSTAPHRAETPVPAGAGAHETEAVRLEISSGAVGRAALDRALQEMIDRRIEIEPKTREIVHQTVHKETGEVLRQVPDEALLRLRAYSREMRETTERNQRRVEKIA